MTRPLELRAWRGLPGEVVVDNFAGGGGASTGIEAALARPVDIAINHDPRAIAIHAADHPETRHFCESIWDVDPREACGGRPVGLAWFSPDCKHHSRAKGSKPLDKNIRALAKVVIPWAEIVRPRVIVLENVEEFESWGPLDEEGRPIKARAGEDFRAWLSRLVELGYDVDYRSLVAADYGTPTTRRRLFLVARRDGQPIIWPGATHGKGRPASWRQAAEIIDWHLPVRSIFGRKKPLAEATMQRIALGIERFVLGTGDPFIIRHGHYSHRTGAGLRPGCGAGLFRGQSLGAPLATVCATNDKHLVVPFLTKHYGGPPGRSGPGVAADKPLGTVTARDHHALTAAFLTQYNGRSVGRQLDLPIGTVTSRERFALVTIHGQAFEICDIGMRMLSPRELFRAQGFPDSYVIDPDLNGKPITKTAQIAAAGNSVAVDVAAAVVAANTRAA